MDFNPIGTLKSIVVILSYVILIAKEIASLFCFAELLATTKQLSVIER
jgi:hypothetical protein